MMEKSNRDLGGILEGPIIEAYDPGIVRPSFRGRFKLLSRSQKLAVVLLFGVFLVVCICILYYAFNLVLTNRGWI